MSRAARLQRIRPSSEGDRRRLRRRNLRVLVDYVSREGVRCEYATTLGEGGIFVESDAPLPVGSALRLRFRLPGGERLHEIEARVAWTHRPKQLATSTRPPGMGVEFTDSVEAASVARELADLLD